MGFPNRAYFKDRLVLVSQFFKTTNHAIPKPPTHNQLST